MASDPLREALFKEIHVLPLPTQRALLRLKDTLLISDARWRYIEETFTLPKSHRLWKLRQLRTELNKGATISDTTSLQGATVDIMKLITDMIRKEPPADPAKPIIIKFAFDACRITTNVQEVIGTISRIRMDRLSKSPRNASQFVVWIGSETYESYQQELSSVKGIINGILKDPKITVDGVAYTLDPYLVLDMKSLCIVLGVYEVYRSNCKYRCCWCRLPNNKIGDFSVAHWPFRSIEEMKMLGTQNVPPSKNYGIKVRSEI